MIFSTSTAHALRALAHLAAHRGEDAVLGRDLAREVHLPAPYLAKVLAVLARAGVLSASRGARGGYRLARPPEEIALIEVVEPLEGKRVHPGCLLQPDQPCSEERSCSAHTVWSEAKRAFSKFLETTTLADIRVDAGSRPRGPRRAGGARPGRGPRRREGPRPQARVRHRVPGTHPGASAIARVRA